MPKKKYRDPQTTAEWQEAVDAAAFYIALDSARQYGLVTGGPMVNIERCEEIIKQGETWGTYPHPLDQLIERYFSKEHSHAAT